MKKPVFTFKTEGKVNGLAFNTNLQWVAAACDNGLKIWDLTKEDNHLVTEIKPEGPIVGAELKRRMLYPSCTSVSWSANSSKLYVGTSDGSIRVYQVNVKVQN